jgi:hypothetical protein
MIAESTKNIIEQIRKGELDCNNRELFFSTLIKGLMLKLDDDISIRNRPVPHVTVHTGSDALYLERKGYNQSIEPFSISNEDYIYQIVPRCNVNLGGIDLVPDQLTNPYSLGQFQLEDGDGIYTLKGEFRRMPVKLGVELKYMTDSYRDMLELIQQIITKLTFIRTFNITYMGQVIPCSYKIPESFSGEHLTELDGKTQDDKLHTMQISLEVETCFPIFSPKTVMSIEQCISNIAPVIVTPYSIAYDIRMGYPMTNVPSYIDMNMVQELVKGNLSNDELKYLDKEDSRKHGITIKSHNSYEVVESNFKTRNNS